MTANAVALTVALVLTAALPFRILGFDGIGPIRVGMTVLQAEQAVHAKIALNAPPDGDQSCHDAHIKGRHDPFSFMIEEGRLTRIDLDGPPSKSRVNTAEGIGLGSSIADIRHAYGRRVMSHPNAYDDEPVFEVKSANGKAAIVFETEHGRVRHIIAGLLPSTEYIEGCL